MQNYTRKFRMSSIPGDRDNTNRAAKFHSRSGPLRWKEDGRIMQKDNLRRNEKDTRVDIDKSTHACAHVLALVHEKFKVFISSSTISIFLLWYSLRCWFGASILVFYFMVIFEVIYGFEVILKSELCFYFQYVSSRNTV